MWLLIDIGNSASKVGLFDPTSGAGRIPGEVVRTIRIAHDAHPLTLLREFVAGEPVSRAGAVSVVPAQRDRLAGVVRSVTGADLRFFDHTSRLPLSLAYETPQTLGHDRIAAAVGGWVRFGEPGRTGVIVVDAGTAVNMEVVRPDGSYPGGVIGPGVELMRDALGVGTAQLPKVDLQLPDSPVGRSTKAALQSGILHGLLDSVAGMVRRIQAAETGDFRVVTTGGWGAWINEQLRVDWACDRNLVLKGISDLIRLADG
ncbi:MAG: type III pantothenate kinase [Bacteroidetes bacterium]|nr:type III pantothenate kinase [Bacteroidota bacterium]MDA0874507.1 type III pantothenate kinase [Bacteroidota bacterium]